MRLTARRHALSQAYRHARYRVDHGGIRFDMTIGAVCEPLSELLCRRGVREGAFLTAFNPGSEQRSEHDNRSAQTALRAAVEAAGFTPLDGVGLDPEGRWPPEPSLLVPGIGRESARNLARRFGQNAFVRLQADDPPALVWTDEPDDIGND